MEELDFLRKHRGEEYTTKELYDKSKPKTGNILLSRVTFNSRMKNNRIAGRVEFKQSPGGTRRKWIFLYKHKE